MVHIAADGSIDGAWPISDVLDLSDEENVWVYDIWRRHDMFLVAKRRLAVSVLIDWLWVPMVTPAITVALANRHSGCCRVETVGLSQRWQYLVLLVLMYRCLKRILCTMQLKTFPMTWEQCPALRCAMLFMTQTRYGCRIEITTLLPAIRNKWHRHGKTYSFEIQNFGQWILNNSCPMALSSSSNQTAPEAASFESTAVLCTFKLDSSIPKMNQIINYCEKLGQNFLK